MKRVEKYDLKEKQSNCRLGGAKFHRIIEGPSAFELGPIRRESRVDVA